MSNVFCEAFADGVGSWAARQAIRHARKPFALCCPGQGVASSTLAKARVSIMSSDAIVDCQVERSSGSGGPRVGHGEQLRCGEAEEALLSPVVLGMIMCRPFHLEMVDRRHATTLRQDFNWNLAHALPSEEPGQVSSTDGAKREAAPCQRGRAANSARRRPSGLCCDPDRRRSGRQSIIRSAPVRRPRRAVRCRLCHRRKPQPARASSRAAGCAARRCRPAYRAEAARRW